MEAGKQILTSSCGHHCGVHMTGKHQYVAHCDCPECHNTRKKEQEDDGDRGV